MKNLKTIMLSAMLCIVGHGVTKADPISDVSQLSNSKVYTITTARGAWTLNTAGTDLVSTHKITSVDGDTENSNADQTAEAKQFAIYKNDGMFYIYNLKAEKFLVLNGQNGKFYQYPTMPFAVTTSNNDSYPLIIGTLDLKKYANNNNGGGIVVNDWRNQDTGNRLAIEEVRDLTDDEVTSINTALAASPFNKNKSFTVTTARGKWCINSEGTKLIRIDTDATVETAGYDQFALMLFDNTPYIYNVGTKKFIKIDGSLAEGRGDAVNVRYSGDATYPYMFFFPAGSIYFNMQTSGTSIKMDTYDTPDPGNKQSLTIQSVDAYNDALAEYNKTVTVTYNLMYEGVQVGSKNVTEPLGVSPTVPASIDKGIFDYSYSTNLIQSGTSTITATATPIFTISPDYVGATWYNMYIRQNDRWVGYNKGADNSTPEPYKPYGASDDDKATKALQWAFVGNPFTTGIKVVNREAGRGKSLKKDGNNAVMRDGDTYWDIFGRSGGILLREHGTDNNYINQNGGSNGTFQFWNSSWAASDNGSTMWLVEAPVETTTITYHVKYKGEEVASTTATAVVDDPTPLTKIPSAITRDFVTLTGDDTHNIVADDNIDLTATWAGPFEITDDYASAHWYDMAVRSNWYVTSDNVDSDGALKTVEANAIGLGEEAYQWAFVGDPYHLKVYNKAKKENLIYAWSSNSNGSIPSFVEASTEKYWWIRKSTASGDAYANAFLLTIPNDGYQLNQNGGAGGPLKIWTSTGTHDAGSAFTIFDVPTDYAAFLNEEVTPYMGSGYFWLKESVKAAMGWNPDYSSSCDLQQYKDMRDGFAAIDKSDLNNYNLPKSGFYRFKNTNYNKYMGLKVATVYGNYTGADETDAATVVKLTEGTGDNVGKYSIQIQGKYLQGLSKSTNVPLGDEAAWFSPAIRTIGSGTFSTDGEQYTYIHCAGGGNVVGWELAADASQWTLEDATSIKAAISAAGYATLYVPFPVTIPSGVKAYAVSSLTGGLLNLTEITTTIPAGTPVILEGEANTYTFNITTGGSYDGDNKLVGTYTQIAAPNESYILQNQNDKVGFYQVDTSEATPNVPANRAYLPASVSSVKAFFFGGGEDAIKSVFDGVANGAIYDLSGRKVAKMQKGNTYIVNGKTVIVK